MAIVYFAKGSNEKISPHFRAREFDCPCSRCKETPIDVDLVRNVLEPIRVKEGKPMYVNGYRCPAHNAEVPNASKTSRHMKGDAYDVSFHDGNAIVIAKAAEKKGVKGIGYYKEQDFVHVDGRTVKSYWLGHEQAKVDTFLSEEEAKCAKLIAEIEAVIAKYR